MQTHRQIPLGLDFSPGRTMEDFVVGECNQTAWKLVNAWPHWPHRNYIFWGPPSVGKSHLVRAWCDAVGAPVFDAGDRATLASLLENPPFAFSIEDIDRPVEETLLFHTMNAVRHHGVATIFTSRQRPETLPIRLRDLASRLNAWPVVPIEKPGDDVLTGLMRKLVHDRGLVITASTLSYALRRMERTPQAVLDLVNRIDHLCLRDKKPVTRAVLAEALRDAPPPEEHDDSRPTKTNRAS